MISRFLIADFSRLLSNDIDMLCSLDESCCIEL